MGFISINKSLCALTGRGIDDQVGTSLSELSTGAAEKSSKIAVDPT